MTQGLSREQIGVTDEMIRAFAETIFHLSNNQQLRRGDPIRQKDFAAIDAHRSELGMSDAQIAARIGLNSVQVTFIRNLEEQRRFRTGHYHRLNSLGGGKRFRADRMTPFPDHFRYSENARALRTALSFDPAQVRKFIEAGLWRDDTLRGWLTHHGAGRGDAVAVVDDAGTISFDQLRQQVAQLAAGLYQAGIRPGDVVAVQLPNTREYLLSFLAISWLGAVMTTLYGTFRESEFATQLAHSRARAVIGLDQIGDFAPVQTALDLCTRLANLDCAVSVGGKTPGAVNFADLAACQQPLPDTLPVPTAADPFLLLYTSGTTSSPKGVPLNSHQMLTNARVGVQEHGIQSDSVVMSAAPFGHLYALYSIQLALCAGATVHLLPQFSPPDLVASIAKHRTTHLFAGPAHLSACLGAGLLDEADLTSLRLIVLSGAAVAPDLVRTLAPRLPAGVLCQLWGMTELQAGMYTRLSDPIELVATSAGRPSPGTEVRIADEQGRSMANGEEGELQARGPSIFAAYFDNAPATEASFTADGWFRSGDIATMDANGNVTLSGRLKDVINRGGVKYNPQEVEFLVDEHPAVIQSAIAPVPDKKLGERACCYAVLKPQRNLTLEDLCDYLLKTGISKHKLPERLEIIDEFPMTATRKIIKSRLRPRKV